MEEENEKQQFSELNSDEFGNENKLLTDKLEESKKSSFVIDWKDLVILVACCVVIMILFYFIVAILGFYQSSRPIVLAKVASQPFFSQMHRGLIKDNFDGTIRKSRNTRISVQMFYSPYSITSRHFRGTYYQIAKEMITTHQNTYPSFNAVNCFDSGGECRKTYKIQKYPILFASSYQKHSSIYNGPLTRYYVKRWLNRLQHAVIRLTSIDDLVRISKSYDVIAVLFTKFSPVTNDTPVYRNFTHSAFQYLDGDPNSERSIFCVVTDEGLANQLHIYNENDIVILNDDLSIISSHVNEKLSVEEFTSKMRQFSVNARKNGIEILSVGVRNLASTALAERIGSGSLLIYFSKNLHYGGTQYEMIKTISKDYFKCEDDHVLLVSQNDNKTDTHDCSETVTSLSCNRNSTLAFMVADSIINNQLAKNFGADENNVIITINADQEITRSVKGNITRDMIHCLIRQHHQAAENNFVVEASKIIKRTSNSIILRENESYGENSNVRIMNKIDDILHSQKNTVILFSGGKWHSSSTSAFSAFHQAATFFSEQRTFIEFVIVDVTMSDVPFNFNFEKLPKIIITSPNRKGNSWSYPDELPLNFPNLVRFITSRPSLHLRVLSLMVSCNEECRYRTQMNLRRERAKLRRSINRHTLKSLRKLARLGYLNRVIAMMS